MRFDRIGCYRCDGCGKYFSGSPSGAAKDADGYRLDACSSACVDSLVLDVIAPIAPNKKENKPWSRP